ncbi:MAG: hypothetical protein KDC11_14090 [Chitinophagaceae bacterium]|nr:hypothetical protein [Chitinophagaceae bacterium]
MKKVLIIVAASITFASCTKNYSCDCESKATGETNQLLFKTNSKSHANRLCDDYASRVRNAIVEKSDYTCKLN